MTNEGILVKLYSLIPNTWMEGAGALQEENLGLEKERERERGERGGVEKSWDTVAAGAT